MPDCIFCRIVARDAPAQIFYEDDTALAFPNLNPVVSGHVMVVPKLHTTNMLDIDPDELMQVVATTQIVAKKVMSETKATGFNLLMANGKDAQQSEFHFHWHIIPRHSGDGLDLWIKQKL